MNLAARPFDDRARSCPSWLRALGSVFIVGLAMALLLSTIADTTRAVRCAKAQARLRAHSAVVIRDRAESPSGDEAAAVEAPRDADEVGDADGARACAPRVVAVAPPLTQQPLLAERTIGSFNRPPPLRVRTSVLELERPPRRA